MDSAGRDREWSLLVAAPGSRREHQYAIVGGRLHDPDISSGMLRDSALFSVTAGPPTDLLDSTRAVDIAEAAGAAAYQRENQVSLDGAHLFADNEGVPVWLVAYAKRNAQEAAMAEIDARTGQVLLYEEGRVALVRATPIAGPGRQP